MILRLAVMIKLISMKWTLLLVFVATLLFSKLALTQQIDTEKSMVVFEIGNFKINTVEGTFKGMHGKVIFNPDNMTNAVFDVCVDAATVDTDIKKRDEHLRGEEFFNAAKYPEICIKVQSIKKEADQYIANGELTMTGKKGNITIYFTYEDQTLKGKFSVKRLDYGLGANTSTLTASNEVNITIICKLDY